MKKLPIKQYTDEYNYSISHTFVCNNNNINSFTLKPKTFHRPWSLRHFKSHLPSLDFCHVMCCNWCDQSKREGVKTKITRQMITAVNFCITMAIAWEVSLIQAIFLWCVATALGYLDCVTDAWLLKTHPARFRSNWRSKFSKCCASALLSLDCSQPSIFSYLYSIVNSADRIARELNASAKR